MKRRKNVGNEIMKIKQEPTMNEVGKYEKYHVARMRQVKKKDEERTNILIVIKLTWVHNIVADRWAETLKTRSNRLKLTMSVDQLGSRSVTLAKLFLPKCLESFFFYHGPCQAARDLDSRVFGIFLFQSKKGR